MNIILEPKTTKIMEGPSFNLLLSKLKVHLDNNKNDYGGVPYNENGIWKCKVTCQPSPKILAEA